MRRILSLVVFSAIFVFAIATSVFGQAINSGLRPVAPASAPACGGVTGVKCGGFYRYGTPPYGAGASSGATTQPSPYPTFSGVPGSMGAIDAYLFGTDANGNSIVSGNPLDPTKLQNLLDLAPQWVRQTDAPVFIDDSFLYGSGNYVWGEVDAIIGEMWLHNVQAVIGTEIGGVYYNDAAVSQGGSGGFNPQQALRYKKPSDFGSYCGALAAHRAAIYGNGGVFEIPGNELNGYPNGSPTYGSLNGVPPAVTMNLTTGGSLTTTSPKQYRITAITALGETLPGSGGNIVFGINGTTESITNGHTFNAPSAALYLGGDPNNAGRAVFGTVGEIDVFNTVLSTASRQKEEGYLACKWGSQGSLPIGHPYKTVCP